MSEITAVKTYDIDMQDGLLGGIIGRMLERPHGNWVRLSDYEDIAAELAEAKDGYARWHKAFLDAKYPEMLPTRADLERRVQALSAALRYWLPELNEIDVAACEYERWKSDTELLVDAKWKCANSHMRGEDLNCEVCYPRDAK